MTYEDVTPYPPYPLLVRGVLGNQRSYRDPFSGGQSLLQEISGLKTLRGKEWAK